MHEMWIEWVALLWFRVLGFFAFIPFGHFSIWAKCAPHCGALSWWWELGRLEDVTGAYKVWGPLEPPGTFIKASQVSIALWGDHVRSICRHRWFTSLQTSWIQYNLGVPMPGPFGWTLRRMWSALVINNDILWSHIRCWGSQTKVALLPSEKKKK